MRLAENTGRKKVATNRHLATIAQLWRAISSQLRHLSTYRQSNKKPVKQQYVLQMFPQYGERRPTLFAIFVTRIGRTDGPIFTIYTSLWRLSAQRCTFGGFVDMPPHLEGHIPKTPIFGVRIDIFKPNGRNLKLCILSKLLHRFQPNFAETINTTKYSSWVVQSRAK